jgi:hypothetical protein
MQQLMYCCKRCSARFVKRAYKEANLSNNRGSWKEAAIQIGLEHESRDIRGSHCWCQATTSEDTAG